MAFQNNTLLRWLNFFFRFWAIFSKNEAIRFFVFFPFLDLLLNRNHKIDPRKSSEVGFSSKDRVQKDFLGKTRCGDMAMLSFSLDMAKKLLANQIPRILKVEYLKNCLSVWADFLHGNLKWWMEHDGNLFFWMWPIRGYILGAFLSFRSPPKKFWSVN